MLKYKINNYYFLDSKAWLRYQRGAEEPEPPRVLEPLSPVPAGAGGDHGQAAPVLRDGRQVNIYKNNSTTHFPIKILNISFPRRTVATALWSLHGSRCRRE